MLVLMTITMSGCAVGYDNGYSPVVTSEVGVGVGIYDANYRYGYPSTYGYPYRYDGYQRPYYQRNYYNRNYRHYDRRETVSLRAEVRPQERRRVEKHEKHQKQEN